MIGRSEEEEEQYRRNRFKPETEPMEPKEKNAEAEKSDKRETTSMTDEREVEEEVKEEVEEEEFPSSVTFRTYLNFWKYLKEFDLMDGLREKSNCDKICPRNNECEFCRTQFPVCLVLARTLFLKVVIRPLFKFLGRSKGRRRSRRVGSPFVSGGAPYRMSPTSPIATILLVCSAALIGFAEACSSRNTPKPRPPPPSARPNITFPTYTCPPTYAAWYCLNGATCFTIKIEESLLYNCECAEGFMGQRCEFKDLDGSYLPSRQRVLLETASIAGGATIAVFLVVIACVTLYLHYQRKSKEKRFAGVGTDRKDGPERDLERRAFNRCLSISMDRLPELHSDRKSKSTAVMMGTRETDHSPP